MQVKTVVVPCKQQSSKVSSGALQQLAREPNPILMIAERSNYTIYIDENAILHLWEMLIFLFSYKNA